MCCVKELISVELPISSLAKLVMLVPNAPSAPSAAPLIALVKATVCFVAFFFSLVSSLDASLPALVIGIVVFNSLAYNFCNLAASAFGSRPAFAAIASIEAVRRMRVASLATPACPPTLPISISSATIHFPS